MFSATTRPKTSPAKDGTTTTEVRANAAWSSAPERRPAKRTCPARGATSERRSREARSGPSPMTRSSNLGFSASRMRAASNKIPTPLVVTSRPWKAITGEREAGAGYSTGAATNSKPCGIAATRGSWTNPPSHVVGVMLLETRRHRKRRTNVSNQSLRAANQPRPPLQRRHSP